MVFFINDKKIKLTENTKVLSKDFDCILKNVVKASPKQLIGKVLILGTQNNVINEFVDIIEGSKLKNLKSVTFLVPDKTKAFNAVKKKFKVVHAGGGIVEKDGKILLIHRQGVWDIAKGKLDKGETIEQCAEREVTEETGVKVKIDFKLMDSFHTYIRNSKRNLKHTHWYVMECLDDSKMCAQAEEKIDEVRWCTLSEAKSLLAGSYKSLQRIFKRYEKSTPKLVR